MSVLSDRPDRNVVTPDVDALLYVLLKVLAAHPDGLRQREAVHLVGADLGYDLSSAAIDRLRWAHERLRRADLSSSPARGVWRITDDGKTFLQEYLDGRAAERADAAALSVPRTKGELSESDEPHASPYVSSHTSPYVSPYVSSHVSSHVSAHVSPPASTYSPPMTPMPAPQEILDRALENIHDGVAAELSSLIFQSSPEFFEKLVLDLLVAMGYGTGELAKRVGQSGDGGIDGVIYLDRLGLEKVYIQAKRWKDDVGRPILQAFYGALAARRANKGVFITTSNYTPEARSFAAQVSDGIVLVDGRQLTKLMIEYGIGVGVQRTIRIVAIDRDYFDELD